MHEFFPFYDNYIYHWAISSMAFFYCVMWYWAFWAAQGFVGKTATITIGQQHYCFPVYHVVQPWSVRNLIYTRKTTGVTFLEATTLALGKRFDLKLNLSTNSVFQRHEKFFHKSCRSSILIGGNNDSEVIYSFLISTMLSILSPKYFSFLTNHVPVSRIFLFSGEFELFNNHFKIYIRPASAL